MRVGIYTHYIDIFPKSAPSLYQIELIRNLSNFKNIEIVLIHHRKNTNIPLYNYYEEAIVPISPYLGEKAINRLNLDILHFNSIPWSWRAFINKIKCKKLATVHGDIWWVEPHLGYNQTTERIKRKVEPKVIKNFDMIIAISHSIQKTIINKIGCSPKKVQVIYPGIDLSLFYPRAEDEIEKARIEYNITSPYIIHVSNYSPIKNPNGLFKTFKLVKEEIKDITLLVIGKGWARRYVHKLGKFGLNKNDVKFLGWINKKQLPILYSGAEAFFTSSYHETFGFPLAEAMACGTPIIASNKYAIPEVVGPAGILHPPEKYEALADSLISIITKQNLKRKLGFYGIKQAKKFTWKNTVKKVYLTYRRILTANSGIQGN